MIENFLTTEQVANILQVHPFTILKFLKQGKLKGVKLGRVYRIKESDVQEFLDSRATNPKALDGASVKSQINSDQSTHITPNKEQDHPRPNQEDPHKSYEITEHHQKEDQRDPHYYII